MAPPQNCATLPDAGEVGRPATGCPLRRPGGRAANVVLTVARQQVSRVAFAANPLMLSGGQHLGI